MKTLKPHHALLIFTVAIVLILGVISLWFFTPLVHSAFDIYWILFAGVLILALTPLGGIRTSAPDDDNKTHPSFRSWILRIVILELSLIAIFYGICHLTGHVLPVLTTSQPGLFSTSLYYLLVHLGLFPFTAFALIACGFGYLSYRDNQDAYFSTVLHPVLKSSVDDAVGLITNTSARAATMYALSSTIAFMSLLIISIFIPHKTLVAFTGFSPIPLVTVFILLALILNKKFNQKIYTLITKKQMSPIIVMLGFTLLLAAALIILILFFSDHGGAAVRTPGLIKSLLKHGWANAYDIFISMWWISWAPITGIFIAKISRGHTIREILLATLALPLLIGIVIFFIHHFHITLHYHRIFDVTGFIIPFIGFLLVLSIMAPKNIFSITMQTYLPKRNNIKHRSQDRFISKLLQFSALMLYFYLPAGITVLCILFFVFMLVLSVLLLLLPFALVKGIRARAKPIVTVSAKK